ncbi:MAG: glycosyltransferase family 2 protein [Candidatus Gastranaerophilaceae bacterium]
MYDNLEIFITTYNRAEMFGQTLKTICEQNAEGFDIIILDNASTDNTKKVFNEIKKQYPNRHMKFVGAEKNLGHLGNVLRTIQMASREWAMIFHDDDLMHPEYIKTAMDLINKTPDAVMASCTYLPYEHPNDKNWENFSNDAYFADIKDFAALMFGFILHNFASTIYKTELLKKNELDNELYGKISDRPYLLDIAKHGKNVILKAPYIRYRTHPGQDTNTSETGPFEKEWFALLKKYKEILGNSWFDKYGIIYNSFVHSQLKLGYHWLKSVNSKMTLKTFKKHAADNDVIRKIEVFKIVEKIYKLSEAVCKRVMYS